MAKYAEVVSLNDFARIRHGVGKVVCCSGGFDPLHPGHATYLVESAEYGDILVALVNGDSFLERKKGRAFMKLDTRCRTVSCIRGVDYVVPFEIEDDDTVCQALHSIRPDVFTNGGDRKDRESIPEWETCENLGIEVITGVGQRSCLSSSALLSDWGEFWGRTRQREYCNDNIF